MFNILIYCIRGVVFSHVELLLNVIPYSVQVKGSLPEAYNIELFGITFP